MFNEHCSSVYEIHTKHMKFAYECCCLVSHPNLTCLRHFEGWFYNEKKRERKKERNDHLNITLEKLALIRLEILNQSSYSFFGIFCPKFKQPTEQWYPKFKKHFRNCFPLTIELYHFGMRNFQWKLIRRITILMLKLILFESQCVCQEHLFVKKHPHLVSWEWFWCH